MTSGSILSHTEQLDIPTAPLLLSFTETCSLPHEERAALERFHLHWASPTRASRRLLLSPRVFTASLSPSEGLNADRSGATCDDADLHCDLTAKSCFAIVGIRQLATGSGRANSGGTLGSGTGLPYEGQDVNEDMTDWHAGSRQLANLTFRCPFTMLKSLTLLVVCVLFLRPHLKSHTVHFDLCLEQTVVIQDFKWSAGMRQSRWAND